MTARTTSIALAALMTGVAPTLAQDDLTPVTFGSNWVAQAEHGGFYQALADGTYEDCGLDVTILPGGPRVNNRALMAAGRIDFYMGGDLLLAFDAASQGVPVVVVAAIMQKHPQVILAHPGRAETFEDLRDLTLLIADGGYASFYQWMIAAHGFTEAQRRPYTFNAAPFLVDEGTAMQGYLTSEPFAIEREAGFEPETFLLADAGYATYATTIETLRATVDERPDVVRCFVQGSAEGWRIYLHGDRSAGDAAILAENPDMTPERIAYAVERMNAEGIVESGDALALGIGAMTEGRVRAFHEQMVEAGVIEPGLDVTTMFTTKFLEPAADGPMGEVAE